MKIIFENHGEYLQATNILLACLNDEIALDSVIEMFTEANKPLGCVKFGDINIEQNKASLISANIEKLLTHKNGKKSVALRSLVCNFKVAIDALRQIDNNNGSDSLNA